MNSTDSFGKTAHVEVPYEGDHCLPCVFMAEVVEEAVKKFGVRVRWEKIYLKRRNGAIRYAELSVKNAGVAPIPSVFINEKLAFDMIPPVEELEEYLEEILKELKA